MKRKIPFMNRHTYTECGSNCSLVVICSEEWQKKCPVRTRPFLFLPALLSFFLHIAFFVTVLSIPVDGTPYELLRGEYHVFLSDESGDFSENYFAEKDVSIHARKSGKDETIKPHTVVTEKEQNTAVDILSTVRKSSLQKKVLRSGSTATVQDKPAEQKEPDLSPETNVLHRKLSQQSSNRSKQTKTLSQHEKDEQIVRNTRSHKKSSGEERSATPPKNRDIITLVPDKSPAGKPHTPKGRENQMQLNAWDVEIVKGKEFKKISLKNPPPIGSEIPAESAGFLSQRLSEQDNVKGDYIPQNIVLSRGTELETHFFDQPSERVVYDNNVRFSDDAAKDERNNALSIPSPLVQRSPLEVRKKEEKDNPLQLPIKEKPVALDSHNPLYGMPDMRALVNNDIKIIVSVKDVAGLVPIHADDNELEHLRTVIAAYETLVEELGRDPSLDQIAEATGLTLQKAEEALLIITEPALKSSEERQRSSEISIQLFKKRHPMIRKGTVSKKRDAIEGTREYSSSKHIFSLVHAEKGLYHLHIQNTEVIPFEVSILVLLYEGKDNERRKTYLRAELLPSDRLLFGFLLPEAVFWDDQDSFSGTIEDSNYITKFNDRTGLVWKERKARH